MGNPAARENDVPRPQAEGHERARRLPRNLRIDSPEDGARSGPELILVRGPAPADEALTQKLDGPDGLVAAALTARVEA